MVHSVLLIRDRAQIYTVPLGMKQASTAFPLPFEGITESDLGMQYMLRCIHPESSLLLMYEFASSIVVLNWKTGQQGIVPISWDDPEEAVSCRTKLDHWLTPSFSSGS